jgi:hypothetical protein
LYACSAHLWASLCGDFWLNDEELVEMCIIWYFSASRFVRLSFCLHVAYIPFNFSLFIPNSFDQGLCIEIDFSPYQIIIVVVQVELHLNFLLLAMLQHCGQDWK